MKLLRFFKRMLIALISIVGVGLIVLLCISGPITDHGIGTSWFGTPKVTFAAGAYPIDTTSLTLTLQEGETELLKDMTMLTYADFSGSTNYDEIIAWGKNNPQVELKYNVQLPTGEVVDQHITSLDLSGIDSETLTKTAEFVQYLPDLKAVELGVAPDAASVLSAESISAISTALPEAEISYAFSLLGQELSMEAESVDLTGIKSEEVSSAATILSCIPSINYVNLGSADTSSISWDDLGSIQAACPNADIDYSFSLYGESVSLDTESMDFSYRELGDNGAAIKAALPYMTKCSFVNMDSCGISNEDMAAIRDACPNTKVVWRVWFGDCYSVRTDAIKILASKPSVGGILGDEINDVLKYCTDMKHIDLGHNGEITDISFVSYMPELETLVIAMNPLADLSPLANCPKIDYLELNSTSVTDLSPLANAQSLRHLNIANCPVSDISPIYGLTELERLWIGCDTPVPEDQVATMKEKAPNIVIDTTTSDPTQGGWRYADLNYEGWVAWSQTGYFTYDYHPRYELLRQQFGYDTLDYSFYYKDPTYMGD